MALLETPNGITLLGASKMREANANGNGHGHNHERFSVERRLQDEDDSFEYGTDRESSVYNPTTKPLRNVLMAQAGGRNSQTTHNNEAERDSLAQETQDTDLLERGNQLGIPESRFSRWLPKDQRELLQKQANLLSGRNQTVVPKATPPAAPPKPNKNQPQITTATTTTITQTTPKLPQETEI